jgi:hypothetical protein
MKKILAAMIAAVVALGLLSNSGEAQSGPSATRYGSQRLTNGTAFVEPALSSQLPTALLNGSLKVGQTVTPITNVSTANASVTLTIPAAGSGLFHYITAINVTRTCSTAITGSAVLTYTSTNLPGSLAWTAGNACPVGSTNQDIWNDFSQPVKSSVANTNTTIVAPAAGATGIVRVTAYYYTGT